MVTATEMHAGAGLPGFLQPDRIHWKVGVWTAGGLVSALGAVVLTGWYAHSVILIQIYPVFVPMQYNTALGFLLSGLGLLALAADRQRWAIAFGAIAGAIGLLTLIEYLFGVDLGIDQLMMEHYVTVKTSHPGRMAPNTALCFSLSGAALVIAGRPAWRKHHPPTSGILGAIVAALGSAVFFGYLVGIETAYGWGHLTRMAVHTSAGFMVAGAGLFLFALSKRTTDETGRTWWLNIAFGIGAATLVVALWQALGVRENAQTRLIMEEKAADLGTKVTVMIEARIRALGRLAGRWEVRGGTPRVEWESDTRNYISHQPGYQAIEWVDASFHVRWIVPLAGNEAAQGLDLGFEEQRRDALKAARDNRYTTVTRPIDLVQGGKGFLVYVPLFPGGAFDGFMVGVFRIGPLLDLTMIEAESRGYSVAVFAGDQKIYDRHRSGHRHEKKWGAAADIPVRNIAWRLKVWPSPQLLAKMQSDLPETVLVGGLALTFLLMMMIYFAQKAGLLAWTAEQSNRELELEVAGRKIIETERIALTDSLEAANRELEAFCYSVSHDLCGPLRSMDGFSQALIEDYAGKLDDTGQDYLRRIRNGSQKMARLIDDLLTLSRISRGELKRKDVNLTEVAETVAHEHRKAAPDRQVRLKLAPEVHAEGDKRLIHVVFDNLLGNAWKFTGDKPQATIEFGVAQNNGARAFFVRDNGAGFDMAYADKLFEPFARLHRSDEFEGTGIGLATVQRIIHRHGGRIWAEGAVDEGATVYFTLETTGEPS